MLVLALEFSRGCTAHAWAGTLEQRTHRALQKSEYPRPGLARGEWSSPASQQCSTMRQQASRSAQRARLGPATSSALRQTEGDVTRDSTHPAQKAER
jgi:hypothetical protein